METQQIDFNFGGTASSRTSAEYRSKLRKRVNSRLTPDEGSGSGSGGHRRDIKDISGTGQRAGVTKRQNLTVRQQQMRNNRVGSRRGPMEAVTIDPRQKKMRHRRKSEIELITTEESYVESLQQFIDIFYTPLCGHYKNLLPNAQTIFGGMVTVLNANKVLLERLSPCVNEDLGSSRVAKIILEMIPWLAPIYKDYIQNYSKVLMQLGESTSDNSKLAAFLDKSVFEKCNPKNLNIHSFLIMPVQRLPRYRMLLEAMEKNTLDEADLLCLQQALTKVKSVSENINRTIVTEESKLRIMAIENQFEDLEEMELLNRDGHKGETRVFIKKAICHANEEPGEVFIFNDVLLVGKIVKTTKRKLAVKKDLKKSLNVIVLTDLVVTFVSSHPYLDNGLAVSTSQGVVTLAFESKAEAQTWIELITKCIDELVKQNSKLRSRRENVSLAKRGIGYDVTEKTNTTYVQAGKKMTMAEYEAHGKSFTELALMAAGLPTYSQLQMMNKSKAPSKKSRSKRIKDKAMGLLHTPKSKPFADCTNRMQI